MKHSGWKRWPAAETMRPAMGKAQCVQSAPVRTLLVGVQCGRVLVGAPRPRSLEAWCAGFGSGRTEPSLPLTLMAGIEGVTEMDGALCPRFSAGGPLTEMVGMLGMTDIEGVLTSRTLGVEASLIEILGIGGVAPMDGTLAL